MATEKRSQVCNGEDDQEQEEEKMEQFFALIRNFQEARNRIKNELRQRDEEIKKETKTKKKQNKIRKIDEEQSSWVPTFEWADFTEEIEFRRPPIIFPNPYNRREEKKMQGEDDGLDLKLAI